LRFQDLIFPINNFKVNKFDVFKISEITDQKVWQEYAIKLNYNTFLHSNQWSQFNQMQHHKVWQFGLFDGDILVSICLAIKVEAKRGSFILVPHGPQDDLSFEDDFEKKSTILKTWTTHLKQLALLEKCDFIRIQPIVLKTVQNQDLFSGSGFRLAPIHVHTELTTLLNLERSEKEILLGMRKTTRQMIKKAEKMIDSGDIEVSFPQKIDQQMHQVYQDTYIRGGAVAYGPEYIDTEWGVFSKDGNAKLIVIKSAGKIYSWGLVLIFGKRAFYHQGGNILDKNIPSSYLLQWSGIKFAKDSGCQTYDFWGVSPKDKTNHPWANISLFKRGFGGNDVELLHAQDYILTPKYWLNWTVEKFRAFRRGF
jgi:peptidoglycan pentaglycine glycine transferase (the first glycine)